MSFVISGVDPTPFLSLYGLSDEELTRQAVCRVVANEPRSFPERVELRDAEPGESLLLLNYVHQPTNTPYQSSHAIFVREGATVAARFEAQVPAVMQRRLISLRAFNTTHHIVTADVVDGSALEASIAAFLARDDVAYLHAHYAKYGCFAATVHRA
ncbi:hypothetical protein FHW69_001247 [Luteibacter sp. Sphag1AF]|uniref:DUF1203 domain-containing protein n=1 Tax=Luteibacter sp. Sphag1AF TaxID=2587031 RepID=UPI0016205DFA|nr:DUF1203 domain-containing protein [Luteibacter sp. Sphag1AF]MBB3226657.1 hypothetical protein [Luteibacter sp. Sphag1AF]